MSNYKPYFRYLKDMNLSLIGVFIFILCLNTFFSMIMTVQSVGLEDTVINFVNQSSIFGGVICIVTGVFYSLSLFNSAMSIKADRVGYLKASLLLGVILAVGFAIFSFGFDILCKVILEAWTGVSVEINSNIPWIDMGSIQLATGIISRILNNMLMFSLAFAVGATWYRLKIRSSIIIFAVIPIGIISYGFNFGMRNPDKINIFIANMANMISNLTSNIALFTGIKCLLIIVSSIYAIMLLIKAPIKEYANDLL